MIKAVRRFIAGIAALAASVAAVVATAGAIAGASSGEPDPTVPCYVLSMERTQNGAWDEPVVLDRNANGVPVRTTTQPTAKADCIP